MVTGRWKKRERTFSKSEIKVKSKEFQQFIRQKSSQSTRAYFSLSQQKKMEIPVPDLSIQDYIIENYKKSYIIKMGLKEKKTNFIRFIKELAIISSNRVI
ncbi:MAG: hypothetical protein MI892_24855, partial [Desulfobacterales bacterium]|nr:hypothetical protein [Desulfobacterales bacterium]